MEDIVIINKLGAGMLGDVYLCSYKNNHYALKIEKILVADVDYDVAKQEWREVDFSYSFGNSYPESFVTLCKHDIVRDYVKKKYVLKNKNMSDYVKNRLKMKSKSKYSIRKLYSLIHNTLKDEINQLSTNQLYSVILQVIYICNLMKEHGYTHNDLHTKNIGIIHTDKNKTMNMFGRTIKTFGIQIKLIDFGFCLHEKYGLSEDELFIHKYGLENEINRLLIRLVKFDKAHKVNKIFSWSETPDIYDNFVESKCYRTIEDFGINDYDRFSIFQILLPEVFQKMLLKDNFIKVNKPMTLIDTMDILFIFKNKADIDKILKYLVEKMIN